MSRSVVCRERLLRLEDSIDHVNEAVVGRNVLLDHKPTQGQAREPLGALGWGSKEKRTLLGPHVDLDERS